MKKPRVEDWSDECTSQGMPKIASKPPEARGWGYGTDSPSWPAVGTNLAYALIQTSSLQTYKTVYFYYFKPLGLWCFVLAKP